MKEQIKYIISTLVIISITVLGVNAWNGLIASNGDSLDATKWNSLVAATVPTGAVMAFNLASCPTGWIPADGTPGTPDLRGTFVRGIGGDANSRDIARTLGDYQADDFKSHNHRLDPSVVQAYSFTPQVSNYYAPAKGAGATIDNWPTTANVGGTETRPKNIALLYCIKQ